MSHWVMLKAEDEERCREVASRRNRDGLTNAHGLQADRDQGFDLHLLGCLGEFAFAALLGREWSGDVGTFKSRPDVGRAEVRTRSRSDYELIVRTDDDPQRPYVHINGAEAPRWLEVVGWIWGYEAQRDGWLKRHGGREAAWFVPREGLRPVQLVSRPKRRVPA